MNVLELLIAGGWLMVLIVLCSIIVLAICLERLYTLNRRKIAPPHLLATVWKQLKAGEMDAGRLRTLTDGTKWRQHHTGAILRSLRLAGLVVLPILQMQQCSTSDADDD